MRFLGTDQFITSIGELLAADVCREIITRFEASADVSEGRVLRADGAVGTRQTKHEDKLSYDLTIAPEGEWAELYGAVHTEVSRLIEQYVPHFPSLEVYPVEGTGYKIQKYERDRGHFDWHFDALTPRSHSRLFALVLYLNDVERGGETEFFYQGARVAPRAGHALLFPAAWTHMHRGCVPESGDKYVISSFFRFRC